MSETRPIVDQIPVTLTVLITYLALAFTTGVISPDERKLLQFGLLRGALVADGEPWRLLSYAFLHGGLLHLAMNTFALMALGPALERTLGSRRFAVLYAVSAIGGGLLAVVWNGAAQDVVGGSGALFGMLGATLAGHMRAGRHGMEFVSSPAGRRLLMILGFYLIIGAVVPMISNSGHIGGLVSGFAATVLFLLPGRAPLDRLAIWNRAGWVVLYLGLIAWTVYPATRWDHLYGRLLHAEAADQDALVEALLRLRQRELGASSPGRPPAIERFVHDYYGSAYRRLTSTGSANQVR